MNDERSFERDFADRMAAERGSAQLPDSFYDDFRQRASHQRQRPRWLALIKEPPMRTSSVLAVGSPAARVAAIAIATLLLALTVAGAGIAGSRLLAADGALVVDPADPNAYQTISDSVAAAVDGDTILVKPGTYEESVAISSDITLRGDGVRGSVVIQFAANGPAFTEEGLPFTYGILLEDSSAHVANLAIEGPPSSGQTMSAVYIAGGAPVIEGVDIVLPGDRWNYAGGSYFRRSALRISGGSAATIRDSSWDGYVRIGGEPNTPTLERNTITGQHIAVGGGAQPTIARNTFLEGGAIRWDDTGSGGLAEGNSFDGGFIGVDEGNDPAVRLNHFRGGGDTHADRFFGAAIGVAGEATPLVEGNEIQDAAIGIFVTGVGAAPEIRTNSIRASSESAIKVEAGTSPTIEDNTIEDNAVGVAVAGPSTPTLSGNTFCGNEQDLSVPEDLGLTLDGKTVCEA